MRIHRSLAQLLAAVGAGLALLALILAAVGIYGVMAFLVNQRVKEIGIRMALGAGSGRVLRDVIGHGLLPVLVGLASGIAGSDGRAGDDRARIAPSRRKSQRGI